MRFVEIAAFDVRHGGLPWPWLAFDPTHTRFAFVAADAGPRRVSTRVLEGSVVVEGTGFTLPDDLGLPGAVPKDAGGAQALALDPSGELLAVVGASGERSVLVTCSQTGEVARTPIASLVDGRGEVVARAVTFDRRGERLWISAERGSETIVALVDARSHALFGAIRSPGFPPPAAHTLHVHPVDDAVLLLAACGQDGTFARVVGWAGDEVSALPTMLDGGGESAGFVGFSADGQRVHLAEGGALRTHAWPVLVEVSSAQIKGDFESSFSGAVLGSWILVDGEDPDTGEDSVVLFDRTGLRGVRILCDAPTGMWAGRLGQELVVTVGAQGDPARAQIFRVEVSPPRSVGS